jgi:aspartyl-tRNA(Asn)/glutamyl-tRNA(Gln) amidotransferase subunit A
MPFDDEVGRMDAVALAGKFRSGELSPVEVTDAALRRMERLEPQLHAFCTPTPEIARAAARQVEKDVQAGR